MTRFPDFTDDYRRLNQSIHAPSHLQAAVLEAARARESTKPRKTGRYSRGFSFLQKAAVAALIALLIPVTAYAAVKATAGIREYLDFLGVKDIEAAEMLINTFPSLPEETVSGPDGLAQFNVLEAACDSVSVYVTAEIKPLTDKYFLVPSELGINETVGNMMIADFQGDPKMTIEDYAASIGKEILLVSIRLYDENSDLLSLGLMSTCKADGTINQYFSGANPYDSKTFPVTVRCHYFTVDKSVDERFEYEIQITDNSTRTPVKTFTKFSDTSEISVQMKEMVIEKTELGYTVTTTYIDPTAAYYHVSLVDAQGNYLNQLDATMPTCDENGVFTVVNSYPDIPSFEGLQFKLIGGVGDTFDKYGPYQILG